MQPMMDGCACCKPHVRAALTQVATLKFEKTEDGFEREGRLYAEGQLADLRTQTAQMQQQARGRGCGDAPRVRPMRPHPPTSSSNRSRGIQTCPPTKAQTWIACTYPNHAAQFSRDQALLVEVRDKLMRLQAERMQREQARATKQAELEAQALQVGGEGGSPEGGGSDRCFAECVELRTKPCRSAPAP